MANRYWVGATTGNTGLWNTVNSWSAASGGASGASVPGASDDVIFDGAGGFVGGCIIDAAVSVISITATAGYTGGGADDGHIDNATNDQTITISGDITFDNDEISLGDATWTVAGNWDDQDVGTFNQNASTLIMTGTSKLLTGDTGSDLNNLTISGTITTAPGFAGREIRGILLVSGTLTISGVSITIFDEVKVTGTGTIDGANRLLFRTGSSITQQDGTISVSELAFYRTHNDVIIPATYDSATVRFYTDGSTHTFTPSAGTYIFTGNMLIETVAADGDAYVFDNSVNNANFTVSGNITMTTNGAGTSTITINMGSGTWTCSGNWDASEVEIFNRGTSELIMNGNGSTFAHPNATADGLYDFTVTGSGVTVSSVNTLADIHNIFKIADGATFTFTGTLAVRDALNAGELKIETGSRLTGNGILSLPGSITQMDGTIDNSRVNFFGVNTRTIVPGTYTPTVWFYLDLKAGDETYTSLGGTFIFDTPLFYIERHLTNPAFMDNSVNDPSFEFTGDVDFNLSNRVSGFTYTKGTGTITFNSAIDQDFKTDGKDVEEVIVNKAANALILQEALTSTKLTMTAGECQLVNGVTNTLTNFAGSGGSLNSDSDGDESTIALTNASGLVSGVIFKDIFMTAANKINAKGSTNAGNTNRGIIFNDVLRAVA